MVIAVDAGYAASSDAVRTPQRDGVEWVDRSGAKVELGAVVVSISLERSIQFPQVTTTESNSATSPDK